MKITICEDEQVYSTALSNCINRWQAQYPNITVLQAVSLELQRTDLVLVFRPQRLNLCLDARRTGLLQRLLDRILYALNIPLDQRQHCLLDAPRGIGCLSVALARFGGTVVAAIDLTIARRADFVVLVGVRPNEPMAAVCTVQQTGQQRRAISIHLRRLLILRYSGAVPRDPALHGVLRKCEQLVVNDAEVFLNRRTDAAAAIDADVQLIVQHIGDGRWHPDLLRPRIVFVHILRDAMQPVAFIAIEMKDLLHDRGGFRIDLQIIEHAIALSHAAVVHAHIPERDRPAAPDASLRHLLLAGPHTQRRLFAFARRLPEADIVQQFVRVVLQLHLAFLRAPDLDSVLNEPLCKERSLVVAAAEPVKHEHEQYIEGFGLCSGLECSDLVTLCRRGLVPRDAPLAVFIHDFPARHVRSIRPAFDPLHGYVVLVHLTFCGHSVQTDDALHVCFSSFCRWAACTNACAILVRMA